MHNQLYPPKPVVLKPTLFECTACGKPFSGSIALHSHRKSKHGIGAGKHSIYHRQQAQAA